MRVKQAYLYSEKENEYLILTANKYQVIGAPPGYGWYDCLPILPSKDPTWFAVFDHCEYWTLKDVPRHYKRVTHDQLPAFVQLKALEELQ